MCGQRFYQAMAPLAVGKSVPDMPDAVQVRIQNRAWSEANLNTVVRDSSSPGDRSLVENGVALLACNWYYGGRHALELRSA